MFTDDDENDEERSGPQHMAFSSIEDLRDHILTLFGGFINRISGRPETETPEELLEHQRQFLEIWEVDGILREMCNIKTGGAYGVGANSYEEYREKMLNLFRALAGRIMSNVVHAGVSKGLLDAEYNCEKDEFEFAVTKEGMSLVSQLRNEKAGPGDDKTSSN